MAFLKTLKAQVSNVNLSIGELSRDVAYSVQSMKNVETQFGMAVSCVLYDTAG